MKRILLFFLSTSLSLSAAQSAPNFKALRRAQFEHGRRQDYRYERKEGDRRDNRGDYRYQKNGERTVLAQQGKQEHTHRVLKPKKGGDRELSRQILAKGKE